MSEKMPRLLRLRRRVAYMLQAAERGLISPCLTARGVDADTLQRALAELVRMEAQPAYARRVQRDNRRTREGCEAALLRAFNWTMTEAVAADEWGNIAACI